MADKFALVKRVLRALGLSEERVEELIGWIQTWLQDDDEVKSGQVQFPYHLRQDFLTAAEQNFFRILHQAAGDWALIAPKVSLRDLFYTRTGDHSQNRVYLNKIDRKHLDFLLYHPQTLKPLMGIELDDSSHRRQDRQQRDRFVDGVFDAAGLPLVHVPVRYSYPVEQLRAHLQQRLPQNDGKVGEDRVAREDVQAAPACPECGQPMILRTAKSGANKGGQFWGCSTFPRCRSILPVT